VLTIHRSNTAEDAWVWYEDGNELFFDKGEVVRFRVEAEQWHDLSPQKPMRGQEEAIVEKKVPYSIIVSISVDFALC